MSKRERILADELPRNMRLYRVVDDKDGQPSFSLRCRYPSPLTNKTQERMLGLLGALVGPYVLWAAYVCLNPFAPGLFNSIAAVAWVVVAMFSWGHIDNPSDAMTLLTIIIGMIAGYGIGRLQSTRFLDEDLSFRCNPKTIFWYNDKLASNGLSFRKSSGMMDRRPDLKANFELIPDELQTRRIARVLMTRNRSDVADDALAVTIAFGPHGVGLSTLARIEATDAEIIGLRLIAVLRCLLEVSDPDGGADQGNIVMLLNISITQPLTREAAR